MNCERIKDSLYDYATNKIDEAEREFVETHLKECQDCRTDLQLLQDTLPIMTAWKAPRLSPQTVDLMTENILNQQLPWWRRLLEHITLPSRFMLPMQALAMACLILVVIPVSFIKEDEVNSKGGLAIDMPDMSVPNPIRLSVENVPGAISDIEDLLDRYQGNIRQRRNMAMLIGFELDESEKEAFFDKLGAIGLIEKPDHGYQTEKGIVFIVVKEK